ncbi:MAG: alpha/beta hydrolase [Clostridiales bacterium]|jgi:pimeloyl-ACP methyl ester carboxylesterase|nr:alpha/beta hydrolase [Clostridiales bacterium]
MTKTIQQLDFDMFIPQYRHTIGQGVPIMLLHGWGGSKDSWIALERQLIGFGHTVITVDFAGFGDTPEPCPSWGIYEYAQSIKLLMDQLGYSQYNIVGHSFGGRVCILLGSDNRVSRMILCNAAGIRPRRSVKYYIKVWSYKLKKKLNMSTAGSGSTDYKNLSDNMRSVFVRVVNQHLHGHLKDVTASTLIVWGDKDSTTPLYMGKTLHKSIKGSGLIVLKDAGHYSYMEYGDKFCAIVRSFFDD